MYLYGKTRQQLINYGLDITSIHNAIGGFDLTLDDFGVVLSAVFVSSSRVLVIPYTVKSISSNALSSISSYINSVDFDQASEVETISNGFQNCVNLTSITLPNSVTSIGDSVFQNCSNLTNITLTNNIRYIGNSAFQDCIKLPTINIPSNIGNVENNVFQNCSSLTSIILPNTVTNIGNNAFKDCINLLTINIPSNINNIGNSTFQNCAKLTSITIPNIVTNIGISSFQDCIKLPRIIIPSNVTNIGNSAFQNCALLKTINMPCSTIISNTAFNLCSDIELTITNSSTSNIIKTDYLNSNTSISSIIILKSVTGINDNAFYQCSNLKNITYQKI